MAFLRASLWRRLAGMLAGAALIVTTPAIAGDPVPAADTPVLPLLTLPDATSDYLRLGADMADRMTMPVEIGAGGPYAFIVDTGSHRSIVATELARHLDLPELPPVQIVSMAGHETVASVQLGRLKFGNQIVSDLSALSIGHDDLGSAGLIGLDSLRNKRLTLDFRKRQLAIGKSAPAASTNLESDVIVVQARSKFGQLILVDSRVDGKKVNVILDTGAEVSIGNMALFNKLKAKGLIIPARPVTIRSVTGQSIAAQFTVVREIEIESVRLNNVPMVFLDAAPFDELGLADKPSMLLGMEMLRLFNRVAIDFGSRHVDFELPQSRSAQPFSDRLLAAL